MTRFSQSDRAEMQRLRESGRSLTEVARRFNTSRQLVHQYTAPLTLDVQMEIWARRKNEISDARADLWSPEEDRLLEGLWLRWKSVARIHQCRRLRRSRHAIDARVRRLGLRYRFAGHRATGSPISLPRISAFGPATSHEKVA